MKNRILYILLLLFFSINQIAAQGIPGLPGDSSGGDNVDDVNAPIHFLIYPFLMLGAYLGYKVIKKQ